MHLQVKPVETLLFESDVVALGTFRCATEHPLFEDSGPSNSNAIVFPRNAVWIEHAGGAAFVGDPTVVPLYNVGQRYRRRAIRHADHSDWIVLADDVLGELLDPQYPAAATIAASSGVAFRTPFRLSSGSVYLEQRRLFESLLAGGNVDALQVEETAVRIAGAVLRVDPPATSGRADAEIVNRVKADIAADLLARPSLRALASRVDVSPFRLCRMFAATGMTLTRYRNSVRLRLALQRVRRSSDLSALAADLGFSSHSHFTSLFRRHFGVTPAEYRGRRASIS